MASMTQPPPPLLGPSQSNNLTHSNIKSSKPAGTPDNPASDDALPRYTSDTTWETPQNTPAAPFRPVPIAPRMGGGRPIGGKGGFAQHAYAVTPGNTPSSLETMGKRIAGRLGGGEVKQVVQSGIGARIAPSYERRVNAGLLDVSNRLATHKETAVNSPPDIQQLQLSSPTLETDNKPDWPTSFDTSTMGGSAPEVKEGKKGQ